MKVLKSDNKGVYMPYIQTRLSAGLDEAQKSKIEAKITSVVSVLVFVLV